MLAGLTIKIGQILEVKNKFWYFLIGFSWVLTYPFLRMSAMLAQPDWFGLIFAFAILLLTLDYRFRKAGSRGGSCSSSWQRPPLS